MSIESEVQTLEPGALVDLFELDASQITGDPNDHLRFHGYLQVGAITWQGVQYEAWPIDAEGFELTPDKPPHPTITVANVDGSISALCVQYEDLVGARMVRHRTLGKYLDGQPEADPAQELPQEVWFVERKIAEGPTAVQFELASAFDFGKVMLPRRKIIANVCQWKYRSAECGYTGPPVADEFGNPTSDPTKDKCGKRLSDCKLRFGAKAELPFGSFPAARLSKR